ncbi:MAG: 3-isopropylmalate/(R)-2-methylmalate dehydratase small subunit, partial [Pseudonocardiales bacterium]|nr:3-isopropylmalate/(R)-2-methylmalate dehydratase small subunit [Pseudonocardiales bacterium]
EQLLRAVEADPTLELTIDVERGTLEAPAIGLETTFPLDESVRERFLAGLDDIAISLKQTDAISSYESTRPNWLPTA